MHETKLKIRVPKTRCLLERFYLNITRYNNAQRNVETPLPLVCDGLSQNVSNRVL